MSSSPAPARRARRGVPAVTALLLAAAGMLSAPAPASAASQTPPVRYVALGDSYSSGVGTGSYDLAGTPCLRSSQAYAPRWAAGRDTRLTFLACSGAKISDVVRHQIPKIPRDTDLVTVTMGGNDTGFSSVLSACTLAQRDETCRTAVRVGKAAAVTTMPVQLVAALAFIRREAPHARVVVIGYPHLFERGTCHGPGAQYVPDDGRRAAINSGADLLDESLSVVSRALGAHFVDVRGYFAGHGVCAPEGQAWINGPGPEPESYHPNRSGYERGYLPAMASAAG